MHELEGLYCKTGSLRIGRQIRPGQEKKHGRPNLMELGCSPRAEAQVGGGAVGMRKKGRWAGP